MRGKNNKKTINPDPDTQNHIEHEFPTSPPLEQSDPSTQSSDTTPQNADDVFSRLYPSQPTSPPLDQSVPSTQSPDTPPQSADEVFSKLYDDKPESTITVKDSQQIPVGSGVQSPGKHQNFFKRHRGKFAVFGIIAIIIGIFIIGILIGYFGLSQKPDPITGSWTYNGQYNGKNISMTLIFGQEGNFNGYLLGLLVMSGHWTKTNETYYDIVYNNKRVYMIINKDHSQIYDPTTPQGIYIKQ